MKRLFTPLLLFLTVLLGGINASAADEVMDLTADMFYTWDGYGADANKLSQATIDFNIGNDSEIGSGGVVCGTGGIDKRVYADITGSSKLIIEGTSKTSVYIAFNRQEDDSDTRLSGTIDDNGTLELDLTSLPYVHLNTMKVNWGSSGTISSVKYVMPDDPLAVPKEQLKNQIGTAKMYNAIAYTEESYSVLQTAISDGEKALTAANTAELLGEALNNILDAIAGLTLADGYSILTKEMFMNHISLTDATENGSGNGAYQLFETSDLPYGDGNVAELLWADLSKYEKLIITTVGDTKPRLCMNRLEGGGQQAATQADSKMLDINPNNDYSWSTEAYQTVDGNVYMIDLEKIVKGGKDLTGYGYARLHCIKKQGWGAGVFVTGMYLYKTPKVPTEIKLAFDIDDPSHIVITTNGEPVNDLQAGKNDVTVDYMASLSISAAKGFVITSLTADDVEVDLTDGSYTATVSKSISYKIATKVYDPLEKPKEELKSVIANAKLYDSFAKTPESFADLTDKIAKAEAELTNENASEASLASAGEAISAAIEGLTLADGYEYLTKEMFKTYGSVEEPGEGTNPGDGCAFEMFKSIGMPYGTSGVDYLRWADLKDYDKLIVTTNGSNGKPRFCMNRTSSNGQEDNGGMLDIALGNGKASTANYLTADGNIFTIDLNKMVNDCGYARLHSMKSVGGDVFVTGMYLFKDPNPLGIPKEHLAEAIKNAKKCDSYLKSEESWNALQTAISDGEKELENENATQESLEAATNAITAAIAGLKLQPGYSELTKEMFKHYESLENPGEGERAGCDYNLNQETGSVYGDCNSVGHLNWADLTNYDKLILKVAQGAPRLCMNRLADGGQQAPTMQESQMIDIKAAEDGWSKLRYLEAGEDGVYTVDLSKMVDDYGFARLHAIKFNGVVAGIYLYKDPEAATEFDLTFNVDDPSHVVVTVDGEVKTLTADNNVVKAADRAILSIAPTNKFKISSLTANDEEIALADDKIYTKTIVKAINYTIATEDANPLAPQIKELNAWIEKAKLYDDFLKTEESWNALQTAITEAETEVANENATKESLENASNGVANAIEGLALVENYSELTPEMFKAYASFEEPGEGETTDCDYEIFNTSRKLYGDEYNNYLKWADLTIYDKLFIVTTGDTKPRISMNRLDANGNQADTQDESKMIEINPYNNDKMWATDAYQTIDENSETGRKTYTIDLKKIVQKDGFARLHSIQVNDWGTGVFVTGMYLYKDPNPTVDVAFNIDDPAHVVIKVNEEAIEGLEAGDNVKSVAFRGALSIAPAEGFVITKLTADGEDVELTEGAYTTTILKEVSYKIETFDPNAKVLFNVNFDIDDASHVVISANGEKLEELVDGSNDLELEENTEVSIAAAEGFLLKSVMAGDVEVELTDGMYTTTITEPVSYTIVTEVYDPLEQPREELNANIERAKLYDAFAKTAESFDALQAAIEAAEAALKAEDATVESITAANENIDAAVKGLELEEGYAYLTAEMFKSYDSVEEPGEGSDAGCAYDLFKVVSTPYGDGNVSEKNWADLTAFDKLILTMGDTKAPRVMMNRMEKEGADADSKEASKMLDMQPGSQRWSTKEYTVYDSENNVFTVDLRKIVNAYGFARLNAIKYPWSEDGAANGMITGMYLYTSNDDLEIPLEALTEAINKAELCDDFLKTEETWNALQTAIADGKAKLAEVRPTVESVEEATAKINAAIDGLALQDGYSELTKEMFKKYKSVEEPGEGEATSCDYNLQTETGKPYGDCINVNHLNWADLTGYDKLILKANSGTPRFCMNRLADGGQQKATMEESLMVDMHAGYDDWSSNRYLESDGDVYTVDLCKLIDDYGFARLHAIKFDGYVTGMYLYKDPVSNKEFTLTFDIDDPTHVVIEVNGEKINDLKAGANEKKVADRSKLSIAPAESFKLTSVTANGESLTLKEGMLVKTIVKDFTFQIVTEDADPLAQPKKALTATIESAKYYDSFAKTEDSFATLTKAIADAEAALTAEDATEDSLTEASDNISKAIEGLTLAEGYSYLTAEMFKKYASVAEPGEGEPTDCAYEIFNTSRMLYGASNDNLKWADLTDYDQLILTTAGSGDLPRFCLNSTTIEINPYDSSDSAATEEYQTIEDNRYVIDVKKIVKDYEFAHLNSIQVNGWGTGTFVTGMYLYKAPYVAVTGFTLDKTEAEMTVGETMTLKATVAPANATDSDVVWSSSNVKVACVDENGNVTALKVGKVTITASCGDFSAECAVKCHTTLGDANWDGKITVTDAVHISNYVVQDYTVPEDWTEAEWKEFYEKGANANGDDRISFADATATVKLALDQESSASTQTRIIAAENEQADALVIGRVSDASLSNVTVPVSLDNSMEYVALQADIILPEGMSVEVKAGGRVADSHTLLTKKFADNHIRVALFNLGNAAFADCQAPILEIVADSNLLDADDIVISNIYASDAHANEYELASRSGEVSGVAGVAGGDIVISKEAGGVVISNAAGSNVWIYTLDGNAVKTLVAKDNVETIDLAAGVYVVKVGDKTLKVVL